MAKPEWILDEFEAEVILPPQRTSEQYIGGGGYITGDVVQNPQRGRYSPESYSVIPRGAMSIGTEYRRVSDFWIRTKEGHDIHIVLDREHPPVLQGHRLTVVFAEARRRKVLVGFVNHNTRRHTPILEPADALQALGLPVKEYWTESESVPLAILARRRRTRDNKQRRGTILLIAGGVLLLLALFLLVLATSRRAAGAQGVGCFMVVVGFVAGLWGLIELSNVPEKMKSTVQTEHSHSFAKDFEEDYFDLVAGIQDDLTGRGPPRPPIVLPPNS